ncbi:MAG: hypothetical protein HC913_11000 [Microscillaceae bacterium]|nr:hypothetical protein [Microscillaceae bacterium]
MQKLLDDWGGAKSLDGFLTFAGTDTQSLLKMFDGQMAIMLESLRVNESFSPEAEGLLCLGVAEPAAVQSLLDKVSGFFLKKEKRLLCPGLGRGPLVYSASEKGFVCA